MIGYKPKITTKRPSTTSRRCLLQAVIEKKARCRALADDRNGDVPQPGEKPRRSRAFSDTPGRHRKPKFVEVTTGIHRESDREITSG